MEPIETHRKFFAELVASAAGAAKNARLIEAFATTPREKFLGPGPWRIFAGGTLLETPTNDPSFLYQDVVVAIAPERHINNGQPVLHALCLSALNIQPGERILHLGAGTGYYTAVLAKLTGEGGTVEAFEIERDLANRARQNLAEYANVTVHLRNASEGALPAADVLYVNAGATTPMRNWLDALRPGVRLLFPLTPGDGPGGAPGAGAMLLVTRPPATTAKLNPEVTPVPEAQLAPGKSPADTFTARFLSPAMFIPCVGARDDVTGAKLAEAFKRGDARNVRSLHRGGIPDASAWCAGENWWLSTAPLPGA